MAPTGTEEESENNSEMLTWENSTLKDRENFEDSRKKGLYTDFEFRFGPDQQAIKVHKIILGHRSSFFKRMFEKNQDKKFYYFSEEFQRKTVELLIGYLYTGKLSVPFNPKEILNLKIAASKLEIAKIRDETMFHGISERIRPENAWHFLQVAREAVLESLKTHLERWIAMNYCSIAASFQFLKFQQADEVLELVQLASRTTTESDLLKGVLDWVAFDEHNRKRHLFALVKDLNFRNILNQTPHRLANSLLKSDPQCAALLFQIYEDKILNTTTMENASGNCDEASTSSANRLHQELSENENCSNLLESSSSVEKRIVRLNYDLRRPGRAMKRKIIKEDPEGCYSSSFTRIKGYPPAKYYKSYSALKDVACKSSLDLQQQQYVLQKMKHLFQEGEKVSDSPQLQTAELMDTPMITAAADTKEQVVMSEVKLMKKVEVMGGDLVATPVMESKAVAEAEEQKQNLQGQAEFMGSELVGTAVVESKAAAETKERMQNRNELVATPETNLMKKLEVIRSEAKSVNPPLVKSKLNRSMSGEFKVGDVVLANTADSPLLYEDKVLEVTLNSQTGEWEYRIHYIGWRSRWDEFAPRARVLPNTWENKQLQVERNIQHKLQLAKKPRGTPKGMEKSFGNDEVTVQSPVPRNIDPLIYLGAKKVKPVTLKVKGDAEPGNPLKTKNNSAENTIVNNAMTEPEKPTEESSNVVVVAKKKKIRAHSAQPVAKKAKIELEGFAAPPEDQSWKLILPGPLLKCLEEDRYLIEQEHKLVKIPAGITVNKLLDEFRNTWSASEDEILKCQIWKFCAGVKLYFNSVLPFYILYRSERIQFEVLKGWVERPGPGPGKWSAVYPPVHLLRMLSKIGDVMTETNLNKTTVAHLQRYFDYLIPFFEKNLERFCYSSEAFVYTENKGFKSASLEL